MINDQPMSCEQNDGFDGHTEPERWSVYIDSAPLVDVMFDQLDYLISHVNDNCTVGCLDCARLTQVKLRLLEPFLSHIIE
jgi:hypothetical protein